MMSPLAHLINEAQSLKEVDLKQSYSIAKELAYINVNILWYPEKMSEHIARLRSLADHVKLTFKGQGTDLVAAIKQTALSLKTIDN